MLGWIARWNDRHPWSHNAAYTPVVLWHARSVRRRGGRRAVDVGCGTGLLVRRLARFFDDVVGIDPDGGMVAAARRRTAGVPGARIEQGTLDDLPDERFDLVTLVAVLHHLPLDRALERLRGLVAPGGRLVVVGLAQSTRRDLPSELVSTVLNPVIGFVRRPLGAATPVHMTAPTAPPQSTLRAIAEAAQELMPGVRVRRGMFWRYVLVWRA